ncbi:hypothetical protein ACGFS9_30135 [Streptomyces sp. NPDC048566]|uniref:hypothetical protein n=1 Tax=Streptomyces sp. NPDC048566 TaxID=3365569 RepID=UPI003713DBBA
MKPEQDPERTPSGETAVKGRVTPVPPERPLDDRAKAADGAAADDVSRREALKGHLDPATDDHGMDDRGTAGRTGHTESDAAAATAGAAGTRASRTDDGLATPTTAKDQDSAARTTGTAAPGRESTAARTGEPAAGHGGPAGRTGTAPSGTSRSEDRDATRGKDLAGTAGSGPAARDGAAARTGTTGALPDSGRPGSDHRVDGKAAAGHDERLLPVDEYDTFSERMRHAVGGFVDGPAASVEEADHVLEELAGRFTEAVAQRRRSLRTAWQSGGDGKASDTDTEKLRLALQDYREMTERLLHV